MTIGMLVLTGFFVITFLAAVIGEGAERPGRSDSGFYLADRRLGAVALFLTTAATNFSAFTVLGLAGAGARIGYAFYPAMGLGTGFMALGLYLMGAPLSVAGRARGWITPVDFVSDRYRSPFLAKAYAVCLVAFTLPYLALQPMAAGMLLESALGIPYRAGVIAVAVLVGAYTMAGGLRAVVRTDSLHGFLLFGLAAVAWLLAVRALGGFIQAHGAARELAPALFRRPGGAAGISPLALAGYFLLWFLADPLFPQLGQRCLAARGPSALRRTVVAYPLVTTALFFLTISTGVLGKAVFPDLAQASSDKLWPLLAAKLGGEAGGPLLVALLVLAPLAAILTTMDSQLLTLSSIIVRDMAGDRRDSQARARAAVGAIAAVGIVIALFPPSDILDFLNRASFNGYAALAPLVFGGLYRKRASAWGGLASVALGEAVTIAFGLGLVRVPGVPDVVIVAIVSWGAFFAASALERRCRPASVEAAAAAYEALRLPRLGAVLPLRWALLFLAAILPAFDFFNWGEEPLMAFGLPAWVWISAAQGLVLSLAFAIFFLSRERREAIGGE